ncbi:N-acetylglucosamine kinase [Actinokineospora globicatena]|uniref:N-acetylglucosamine kinase n=1 Tax=Actinokineospora globicatena TaxID=103729 RepID=UPI0020A409F1|nr:BadF/BadG/BcrA/BcrD ATPase family protein [Actinokineospora globicatena]MCP2300846.1 BadF-type ATPase [Actinokineospora globicatena]GLW77528.1 N-acetylglucosamine kinase [Actinokineospora globicatena]GLW84362.1 N-acetylglucosamine kinase [Actinokineospora globicatena]
MTGVALGVDIGGSTTRALAVDASGAVVGRGVAGGGNPNTNGPAAAAGQLLTAVNAALGGSEVAACVIGMAGSSALLDPAVAAEFDVVFELLHPRVVTDAEVAFASGTSAAAGTVLISGTGSIAGRIAGRELVATYGGFGWLLGDEGSAFWIGREAVRHTLYALQSGKPLGPLPEAVLTAAGLPLGGDPRIPFGRLIRQVNREEPIRLARFAPIVPSVDAPAAHDIVDRAARSLANQALAVHDTGPVVLAGAVLQTVVGARVRELLAEHEVVDAKDGTIGAAWLASLDAFGKNAVRPLV